MPDYAENFESVDASYDFETASLSGWTFNLSPSNWSAAASYGNISARGNYSLFHISGGTDFAAIWVDVPAGSAYVWFSCYAANWSTDTDNARMSVQFYQDDMVTPVGSEIVTASTTANAWVFLSNGSSVPSGGTKLRIRLRATLSAGQTANVGFDDVLVRFFDSNWYMDFTKWSIAPSYSGVSARNNFSLWHPAGSDLGGFDYPGRWVDVPVNATSFSFTAYGVAISVGADEGHIAAQFYQSNLTTPVGSEIVSSMLTPSSWTALSVSGSVPTGGTKLRIRLYSKDNEATGFDDLEVSFALSGSSVPIVFVVC